MGFSYLVSSAGVLTLKEYLDILVKYMDGKMGIILVCPVKHLAGGQRGAELSTETRKRLLYE